MYRDFEIAAAHNDEMARQVGRYRLASRLRKRGGVGWGPPSLLRLLRAGRPAGGIEPQQA